MVKCAIFFILHPNKSNGKNRMCVSLNVFNWFVLHAWINLLYLPLNALFSFCTFYHRRRFHNLPETPCFNFYFIFKTFFFFALPLLRRYSLVATSSVLEWEMIVLRSLKRKPRRRRRRRTSVSGAFTIYVWHTATFWQISKLRTYRVCVCVCVCSPNDSPKRQLTSEM